MTFSLIAMPAAEELAMEYFPPDGVSREHGDSAAFRKIAGTLAKFPCEDCIQPPVSPHQIKD